MRRLSYETTASQSLSYELRMLVAYFRSDCLGVLDNRVNYLSFLHACGWTEDEFNIETLRQIDNGWRLPRPSPRGNHPMPVIQFGMAGSSP